MQFKDSFSFMASSLDKLVKNLGNDKDYDFQSSFLQQIFLKKDTQIYTKKI